jgi:hypothetical protein
MNGSGARSTASMVDVIVLHGAGLCWLLVHAFVLFCSVLLALTCRRCFLSFVFYCLVSYLFPVLWLQNMSYVMVLSLIKSPFCC